MRKKSKIWNKLIYAVNLFTAFLLFLTSTLSFFETQFLAVLSLFVPFLFFLNLVFLVFWLLRRKRQFLLSFLSLLFGYISFGSFYGFGEKSKEPLDSDLKVMSYNVGNFNKYGWIKEPNIGDRTIDLINKKNPDVICIQEHSRIRYRQLKNYAFRTETPYSERRSIQAIFSKFPIVGKGSLNLPNTINNIIYADVEFRGDTIRIYNVHLQSFKIVPSSMSFSGDQGGKIINEW